MSAEALAKEEGAKYRVAALAVRYRNEGSCCAREIPGTVGVDCGVGECLSASMHAPVPRLISETDKRKIIVGVLTAMFLAALDQTIVAPALPTIGASLGHLEYLPWIITAYLLTATAVTPLYGKVSDIRGRRPVLFIGIAIFMFGSLICAPGSHISHPWRLIASA